MTNDPKTDPMVTVEVISGVEGPSVAINNARIAGPKPWGGGVVEWAWEVPRSRILEALVVPTDNQEHGAGTLEVGLNVAGEVVVNGGPAAVDANGMWHIVFSKEQARNFIGVLLRQTGAAEGGEGR
jgi:hypothetical protein